MGRKNAHRRAAAGAAVAEEPRPAAAPPVQPSTLPSIGEEIVRISKALGSLQLAILLLSSGIVILALGTMLESWYSAKLAKELVYRTWWFSALLGLLAVNIFFAAAKKWPWKRHQLGFLVTHAGLLMLLAGGLLNVLGGTDAMMILVDTDQRQALSRIREEHGYIANRSSEIYFPGDTYLSVAKAGSKDRVTYGYCPGSLPWGDDDYDTATPRWLHVLEKLAHPMPRAFRQEIDKGVHLAVTAFYPHCETDLYGPAQKSEASVPAAQYRVFGPRFGWLPANWLALNPAEPQHALQVIGAGTVEFLGNCPRQMEDEFLKPPTADQRGAQGQLVIKKGSATLRVNVAEQMGKALSLGETGWQVQLDRYQPELALSDELATPAVEVTLIRPDGKKLPYLCTSRFNSVTGPAPNGQGKLPTADPEAPLLWLHPPDWRFGAKQQLGALHFAAAEGGRLLYRSFSSKTGVISLENSGEAKPGAEELPIWGGMGFRLQVRKYLPRASSSLDQPNYHPVAVRPGLESRSADLLSPVLRCVLTAERRNATGQLETLQKTFMLRQESTRRVTLEGQLDGKPFRDSYSIGFHMRQLDLPFEVRLVRAEQQVDRGSGSPATFTSFVQVTDLTGEKRAKDESHIITMNEPMDHGGFRFFQSDYQPLRLDANGKPVSKSGLTVANDPGLPAMYLGSVMLSLGIILMFYMKAYSLETMRRALADRLGHAPTPGSLA